MSEATEVYQPKNPIRVITATSLFDGHDASINIIRRIIQDTGAEVIHLGHNRSVEDIVIAAVEEDAQGVGISSYQGGHLEFFKYMVDLLKEKKASHIKVFGGGGGVIIPEEIEELEKYGVAKIYSPNDGLQWGLQGMINHMVKNLDFSTVQDKNINMDHLSPDNKLMVANLITAVELEKNGGNGHFTNLQARLKEKIGNRKIPVVGITGTGGSGKSSLTDELILRLLNDMQDIHVAIVSCDPTRRRTRGALLGDRIRMNSIGNARVFLRSLATRHSNTEIPDALPDALDVLKAAGFDLIIAETAGIGQGDSRIVDLVDQSVYVMTSEFGAASQLEKIDMLDYADFMVVNKFEKRGGEDAVRDVRKQVQDNRKEWDTPPEEMPVYGTIASKFNDDGLTAFYHALMDSIHQKTGKKFQSKLPRPEIKTSTSKTIIIPPEKIRYLSEIANTIRAYHKHTEEQMEVLRSVWHLKEAAQSFHGDNLEGDPSELIERLKQATGQAEQSLSTATTDLMEQWDEIKKTYQSDELVYRVRNQEYRIPLFNESLSRKKIPKISLP